VALIDRARQEIDIAAYVLTDWPVIQALTRAADRGVHIRVYLDKDQLAEHELAKPFNALAETPTVKIRIKRDNSAPMHPDCRRIGLARRAIGDRFRHARELILRPSKVTAGYQNSPPQSAGTSYEIRRSQSWLLSFNYAGKLRVAQSLQ
jgi:PLD-like domain